MAIARHNGNLRGKPPALKPAQDREIRRMHDTGGCTIAQVAALFNASGPAVYRSLQHTVTPPRLPGPPPGNRRPAPSRSSVPAWDSTPLATSRAGSATTVTGGVRVTAHP